MRFMNGIDPFYPFEAIPSERLKLDRMLCDVESLPYPTDTTSITEGGSDANGSEGNEEGQTESQQRPLLSNETVMRIMGMDCSHWTSSEDVLHNFTAIGG